MRRILVRGIALVVVLGVTGTACTKSSTPAATPPTSGPPVATIPSAKTISEPVTYGYYDGHIDTMLSTDVSDKTQSQAQHINYSAALVTQPAGKFPSLYTIIGPAAPDQPVVFGTEPGESDYTPLWHEIDVRWKTGVKPVLLVKDDQITGLASQGKLTIDPTSIVLNCPIVQVGKSSSIPAVKTVSEPVTYGYYDGHIDTMLSTDVSDKAQAASSHINFSASLLTLPASKFPSLYTVIGLAAPDQPVVFGTEPGESDYSPLWQEVDVRWNTGVQPVLLVKDDQVKELASEGKLTIDPTPIVLNCPIIKAS